MPAYEVGNDARFVSRVWRVRQVNFIRLLFSCCLGNKLLIRLEQYTLLVQIRNCIGLEGYGVVSDDIAISYTVVQLTRDVVPNVLDCQSGCSVRIIRFGCPATELYAVGQSSHAGVINVLFDVINLILRDHHRGNFVRTIHELDGESSVGATLHNDVHGELIGLELNRVLLRNAHLRSSNLLDGAVVLHVEDVGSLGVNLGVAEGHIDGKLGLDFLVLVPERDVDSLNSLDLIVGHGVDLIEDALRRNVLEAHLEALGQCVFGNIDGHLSGTRPTLDVLCGIGHFLLGLGLCLGLSLGLRLGLVCDDLIGGHFLRHNLVLARSLLLNHNLGLLLFYWSHLLRSRLLSDDVRLDITALLRGNDLFERSCLGRLLSKRCCQRLGGQKFQHHAQGYKP